MEIRKQRVGDVLELEIQGRLDGYWADHLSQSLDDAIREGARNLRLNLSEVSYLSSAGIRVLVRAHKQLSAIQGSFSVSAAVGSRAIDTPADRADGSFDPSCYTRFESFAIRAPKFWKKKISGSRLSVLLRKHGLVAG